MATFVVLAWLAAISLALSRSRDAKTLRTSTHAGSEWRLTMLLSDDEIRGNNLIEGALNDNYRAAGYDLSVGLFITVQGRKKKSIRLRPQGIVEIISKEKINLPSDVVAFAAVKTRLCNEGLLPLNIGIIDPDYHGLLSTTLLNFGKTHKLLKVGDPFLRLTFHRCSRSSRADAHKLHLPRLSDAQYLRDKEEKVLNFAETFLNLDATVREVSEPIVKNWKNELLKLIPLGAVGLALLAFAVTLGVNWVDRHVWSKEDIKHELRQDLREDSHKALQEQVDRLDNQVKQLIAIQQQGSKNNKPPVRSK
jgi:deoxycytidine triphosphate deaminase